MLAALGDTLLSAQPLANMCWQGMQCPKGLACVNQTLYIADTTRVLFVDLPTGLGCHGSWNTLQGGFIEVTSVDAWALQSTQGAAIKHQVALSDRGSHTVRVLEREAGVIVGEVVHGQNGAPGNLDGPASYFLLDEPVGVHYFGGTLLVASYGGVKNGNISTITNTSFGVKCMVAINDLYSAIGFDRLSKLF